MSSALDTLSISELKKKESWETVLTKVPLLPRGWFELAGINPRDRLELYYEFWLSRLEVEDQGWLTAFFSSLETIEIFAYRFSSQGPFQPCLLYLGKEGHQSFIGYPPVQSPAQVPSFCGDTLYRRFFYLHDGLSRFEDKGVLSSKDIARSSQRLRDMLIAEKICQESEDCHSLGVFPFYEGISTDYYYCFFVSPEICRDYSSPILLISQNTIGMAGKVILGERPFISAARSQRSFVHWLKGYLLGEMICDDH